MNDFDKDNRRTRNSMKVSKSGNKRHIPIIIAVPIFSIIALFGLLDAGQQFIGLNQIDAVKADSHINNPPVAVEDTYTVDQGETIDTMQALTITEIIDSIGDGDGNTFQGAEGIVADNQGNVYVAGITTDNVFKITPAGVITEVIDSTGDGVNPLTDPFGLTVDNSGNFYVAGAGSDNAFKITPSGVISQIIDSTGDGISSTLASPYGIAVDSSENVYITGRDSDNAFKITTLGTITQIIDSSGDGAGSILGGPFAIAVDQNENVYLTGRYSDNAFRISSSGVITEIIDASGAGTGMALSVPYGIAVDNRGNAYISGSNSDNAFKVSATGTITEIIDGSGGGAGQLNYANGVAVDYEGFVYVVGSISDNAFKIAPSGQIVQIIQSMGDGQGNNLAAPDNGAVSVDTLGNVFISGYFSNNAFKIEGQRGVLFNDLDADDDPLSAVLVSGPSYSVSGTFSLESNGALFYEHDGSATTIDTFTYQAYDGTDFSNIITVTINIVPEINEPPVANNDNYNVFNGGSLSPISVPIPISITEIITRSGGGVGVVVNPDGLAIDSQGNVYAGGCGNGPASSKVFKIDPGSDDVFGTSDDSTAIVLDGNGDGSNEFDCPVGMDIDSLGNLFVAGHRSDNVFKIDPGSDGDLGTSDDNKSMVIGPLDGILAPYDLIVDSADNIFVTGYNSDNVLKLEPGGVITEVLNASGDGSGNSLNGPFGIDVDSSDNIFVAGNEGNNAFKITSSGEISEIIDSTGDGTNLLSKAVDVVADELGNVYVTGNNSDNVFKVDSSGVITEVLSLSDGIDNPTCIEIDLEGNVFIAGFVSDNVLRLGVEGAITEILDNQGDGTSGFDGPADDCLAVDDSGNIYATGTLSYHNVFRITAGGPIGVLHNDTDVNGDLLTATLVTSPTNALPGSFALNPDGSFTYSHDGSTSIQDSFTYQAFDGVNLSNVATATISNPGASILLSPTGLITDSTPIYTWSRVAFATQYQLYVLDDQGAEVISSWYDTGDICNLDSCNVTPTTQLANGDYSWYVKAAAASGSVWSLSSGFTIYPLPPPQKTTLVSPIGAIIDDTPAYIWDENMDATDYQLYVIDESSTEVISQWYTATDVCDSGACLITPTTTLLPQNYIWYIKAANMAGSAWSDPTYFNYFTGPPSAAVLVEPVGVVATATPTYTWNDVGNAPDYQLYIVDGQNSELYSEWHSAVNICAISQCSVTSTITLTTGDYTWFVKSANIYGSAWSQGMDITFFDGPNPQSPVLISPSGVITTDMPNYNWNEAQNAVEYQLYILDDLRNEVFSSWFFANDICGAGTCVVTDTISLTEGEYTWFVKARNPKGGAWSQGLYFNYFTDPAPSTPILISPSGTITDTNPTYSWNESPFATKYQLYVIDSTQSTVVYVWYLAGAICSAGTCSATPSTPLPEGSYTWFVKAWNPAGGAWSQGTGFTIASP